jgi:tRNA pseudouridine(55) synthase
MPRKEKQRKGEVCIINGLLNVLKPPGMTSFDVVAYLRRVLKEKKIGHAGTLDPGAAGVLPICIGKATKSIEYIMDMEKVYRAELTLGISTDTQDSFGKVISVKDVSVSEDEILYAIKSFTGELYQTPPMYSALKVDGRRLYELAREGKSVKRKPRKIIIHSIDIIKVDIDRGSGIIATHIGADGNLGHNITIPCCYINQDDINKRPGENKRTIRMDGSEVFRFAVRVMVQATEKVLEEAGLSMDDIKLVIPHQANIRIIDGASKRLEIDSNKVYANVHKYGNTSSASIPIALDEAAREGLLSKGDNIILVGFGGGLTWASALINWVK